MSYHDPIQFYNRYTKKIEVENVYGEAWLRFIYGGNPLGRLSLCALVRRTGFSAWYGWRMNQMSSANKVLPFVVDYNLNAEEFAKPATAYRTFNEFFYRKLKTAARPIAHEDNVAVFPADGRHLAYQNIDCADGFYAKGKKFTLVELLNSQELGREFAGGSMLISRLCPVDYHRYHFPVSGTPEDAVLVKGWLYSVSPLALRVRPCYLVENKRMVTLLSSERFGRVAIIEVGATMVGAILQTYAPGKPVLKGSEKGFFAFGGSCVITVFAAGKIRFDDDLLQNSSHQIEVYAKMGDRLGESIS